jgi:4-carboxymuconolactone decarboxylase
MPRLTLPTPVEMTEDQRKVHDATTAGRRGHVPAPVLAWLHSPELADRAQRLGEFVRYETTLSPRLSELAILVVARHWTCQYEWASHRDEAVKAGLAIRVIEAIAARQPPRLEKADEQAVFNFCVALTQTHVVSDAVYQETLAAIGERATVELVGLLGYYTLVAMTLNAFEIDPSDARNPALSTP